MKEAAGDNPAKGLMDGLMASHAILRKIERAGMDAKTNKGGKPIAAALPGTALGIGLEIPLACHRMVLSEPKIVKPWDEKGYKMPGGAPYHPAGFMTFVGASAMVNGKTQGVYPAAKALLSAVYEGALVPFDTALKIEARWFTNVLMNPSSEAMIRSLFINKEALEKGANRPAVDDQKVKQVGVIGAGMMGAGIALVSAMAGIKVVLIDSSHTPTAASFPTSTKAFGW